MSWRKLFLPVLFAAIFVAGTGNGMTPPPTIRVGLGMTITQLRAGSTYPFKGEVPTFETGPQMKIQRRSAPALHYWVITEPYDLTLVYKGHELKKDDLGGSNYLIAITTDPVSHRVDSIVITFQNQTLTLGEALSEAKVLNNWFLQAGFRIPSSTAEDYKEFVALFFVGEQEPHAPRYSRKVTSYVDMRKAFLDTRSRIIDITPFELATNDASVSLQITNARRWRENAGGDKDESNVSTEHEYFLKLSMVSRPWDRYDNAKQHSPGVK